MSRIISTQTAYKIKLYLSVLVFFIVVGAFSFGLYQDYRHTQEIQKQSKETTPQMLYNTASNGLYLGGARAVFNADGEMVYCQGSPEECAEMERNAQVDKLDSENEYTVSAKRKHIDAAKSALSLIYQHHKEWGINDQFAEECRQAYNNIEAEPLKTESY